LKWSIRVGKLAGIDVYLHLTFLILIGWFALNSYLEGKGVGAMLLDIAFILLLFGIIVLHELGHALAARRFGVGTIDITLLPIGGVARLERIPSEPVQELIVALAGPAVNFLLAALLFLAMLAQSSVQSISIGAIQGGDLIARLLIVNIFLALFNLVPAFPMDGGRALRALLAMRLGRLRATEIAAGIGQTLALVFGFVGIFANPMLVLIALFVWIGAEGEANQVRLESVLSGVPISSLMAREFKVVRPGETLADVAQDLIPGFQTDFPVVENGLLIGMIGLDDIVRGICDAGPLARIDGYVRQSSLTVQPNQRLEEVLQKWQEAGNPTLAVLDGQQLVGLVTSANIGEYVMIQTAVRANQGMLSNRASTEQRPDRT
jgi:Zn-dependent protease/CBS domain-containing protein